MSTEKHLQNMEQPASYGKLLWNNLKGSKLSKWAIRMLVVLIMIGGLADFIANEKPLYCKIEKQTFFPVLHQYAVDLGWTQWEAKFIQKSWYDHNFDQVIWAPIPYSYHTLDYKNFNYASPFKAQKVKSWRFRHWLGTDKLGRDILAGLIHGTQTALLIGIVAMGLATLIGVCLGGIAGYFGNQGVQSNILQIILWVLGGFAGVFYGFIARSFAFSQGPFVGQLLLGILLFVTIVFSVHFLSVLLIRTLGLSKGITIPVDDIIMRLIEIVNATPKILLILGIVAVVEKQSIVNLMVIIGLISWAGIARFVRAEMLKVQQMEYIQAAKALGYPTVRILFKHALPNAITPVLVAISFGIAGAILLEATLSFLGIGISAEMVTWGTMLNESRSASQAWWMVVFPGLAIFFTILIFNILGDAITKAIDARRR